ncbi:MAG: InlB B-repeat-containing protein, partial [Clostridia bacterium]|nr:InlB B-repeat-containing protein [Clostridia bacterium]
NMKCLNKALATTAPTMTSGLKTMAAHLDSGDLDYFLNEDMYHEFTIGEPTAEVKYKATFIVDGVTVSEEEYSEGEAIVAPADPEKEGYTFAGWDAEVPETMGKENLVFNATWTALKYEVSFDNDGNVTSGEFECGSTITLPQAAEKQGHTFVGWFDENGNEYTSESTVPVGGVKLTAKYEKNTYNVVFDADNGKWDDGETVKTVPTEYGAKIDTPADPEKEGYTFAGWDAEIPDSMPANNLTFTATWKVNEYTVTWIVDGETTEETYEYGEEIVAPADPEKEGHTFAGWDAEIPGSMPANDLTFNAVWNINKYNVTWNVDGKETTDLVEYGASIVAPADPEKEGHTFAGWDAEIPATMGTEELVFNATWTVNEYTVTWDVDGETTEETYEYGEEIVAPADPEKEGHTFVGWTPAVHETMPAEDVVYTATWNVNKYTVTWNVDGEKTEEIYEYGAAIVAPADPEKEGFIFTGWDDEIPATMGTEDLVFNATWKEEVAVYFMVDGEVYVYITNKYIDLADELAGPDKEGYAFDKWVYEDGTEVVFPVRLTDKNIYVYAKYSVRSYNVTWDVDGEKTEETYKYGAAIVAPADPEKVGYTFTGWTPAVLDTMPAEDLVYTATWKVNEYTVTWTVDGETTEETYEYGASIVAPADPEKVGYTFAGWTPAVLDTMPAEDLAYEATWTKNKYNAVFDANGGQFADGASTATVATEYEAAVVAPEAPVKDGYAFVMWTPELTDSMPAEEVKYTAVWAEGEGTPYIVETYTMDANGEYGDAEIAYYAAESGEITITPDTEEGFSVDEELSVLSGVVSDADMLVLKAYIARNKYTATFDANGGSFADSNVVAVELYYGAAIDAPTAPVMDEYNFDGWDAEIPATMPAKNLTFKATWVLSHVHTEGDWEIVKEATVDAEGEAVKKCTSCGEIIETATIAKLTKEPATIVTDDGETFESGSEITYGETVVLSVDNVPENAEIEWTVEGEGVEISVSADGKTCEITSVSSGKATVKATIVTEDGTETVAEVTINSDACFFQRVLHFFRSIFNFGFIRDFFSKIF